MSPTSYLTAPPRVIFLNNYIPNDFICQGYLHFLDFPQNFIPIPNGEWQVYLSQVGSLGLVGYYAVFTGKKYIMRPLQTGLVLSPRFLGLKSGSGQLERDQSGVKTALICKYGSENLGFGSLTPILGLWSNIIRNFDS